MSSLAIEVSDHAIAHYRDRVRPGLTLEQAADELYRVLATCKVRKKPPDWSGPQPSDRKIPSSWAMDPDETAVALPLYRHQDERGEFWSAATTITPGSLARRSARSGPGRRGNIARAERERARPRSSCTAGRAQRRTPTSGTATPHDGESRGASSVEMLAERVRAVGQA
jgi:hypothetical protein